MMGDGSDIGDREIALVTEVNRLRALLDQAGIDARHHADEIAVAEQKYARYLEVQRAEAQAARIDADEVRHRLRNTLTIVQAIANRTLRDDRPLDEARAAFNARLDALARVHEVLFMTNWTRVDMKVVLDGILAPYSRPGARRIRARGPDLELNAKQALAFALALNELATNCVKYGCLSQNDGYVAIVWTVAHADEGAELRLRWRERNGPPAAPPQHKGFGTRLIEQNLATEFNGTVELAFRPDGLRCTMRAPAPRLAST